MSHNRANFLLKKLKSQVNPSVNDIEVLLQCDTFAQISAYKTPDFNCGMPSKGEKRCIIFFRVLLYALVRACSGSLRLREQSSILFPSKWCK